MCSSRHTTPAANSPAAQRPLLKAAIRLVRRHRHGLRSTAMPLLIILPLPLAAVGLTPPLTYSPTTGPVCLISGILLIRRRLSRWVIFRPIAVDVHEAGGERNLANWAHDRSSKWTMTKKSASSASPSSTTSSRKPRGLSRKWTRTCKLFQSPLPLHCSYPLL